MKKAFYDVIFTLGHFRLLSSWLFKLSSQNQDLITTTWHKIIINEVRNFIFLWRPVRLYGITVMWTFSDNCFYRICYMCCVLPLYTPHTYIWCEHIMIILVVILAFSFQKPDSNWLSWCCNQTKIHISGGASFYMINKYPQDAKKNLQEFTNIIL